MMTHHKRTLLLAAAAVLGLAGPAAAQTGAVPTTAPASGAGANLGDIPQAAGQRANARVEQHIAELQKRLAIKPAQQSLWDAFTTAMRQNARDMERNHRDSQAGKTVSAIDGLRDYAAESRLHADNLARLLPPFEALYASMSSDQKAAADKTFQTFQRGGRHRGA